MTDLLLVNPPLTPQERYGALSQAGSNMANLGLMTLAASARQAGFKPGILEAGALNLSLEETLERIKTVSPKYLALTCVTLSFHRAALLAKAAKDILPSLTTVIGGPHFTALPQSTMEENPQFDFGVLGEGEITLTELLKTLENGGAPEQVAGIYYRQEEKAFFSKPREFIPDLDALPLPAWDLLEGFPRLYQPAIFRYLQLPAANLVFSRGCPFQCTFCDRSVFGHKIRSYSPDYIIEMMRVLKSRYGVREILFEDDTFFVFKDRLREVLERMIKEKFAFTWSCLARADMLDGELLKLMKKAGCWQIAFGIESADEAILELLQKKMKPETVAKAVQMTKKTGILTKGFFILGSPLETRDTFRKSLEFAKKIGIEDFSLFNLTPFPGSKIYEIAGEYGEFDRDWSKMNLLTPVFLPRGLTAQEMTEMNKQALKEFYWRPQIFASYFKRMIRYPAYALKVWQGLKAFTQVTG